MNHAEVLIALARLPDSKGSAAQVTEALGHRTDRSSVAMIRAYLERLENAGRVQRTKNLRNTWIWKAL